MGSLAQEDPPLDVIIVGGGFCGTWLLQHLRKESFSVRLYEHASQLGGIWAWNNYPGARVDTPGEPLVYSRIIRIVPSYIRAKLTLSLPDLAPTYQLGDKETWVTWEWKQLFPGRDELVAYFRHLEQVWNLTPDISFNSRVSSVHWDEAHSVWRYEINDGEKKGSARSVVLCTGFAAKRYVPPWKGMETFRGETVHTSRWPQTGYDLDDKRVAIIGTGATGVQTIQEVSQKAAHLTVFQRTPNTALPMQNPDQTAAMNKAMRVGFEETKKKMKTTFAGFDYEFSKTKSSDVSKEERMKFYEELYNSGGLQLWLGAYADSLFIEEYNEEIYQFWRSKTLRRIKGPRNQELLAPEKKLHPFGTKRISLEQTYFEAFNQPNVSLVSTRENDIAAFVPEGIQTADGKVHEVDVIIFATGFDTHTGGMTQIDLRGLEGQTMEAKWKEGVYTHLGITVSGFPNLFFCYGPQAPTAFATGPSHAENQGAFIVDTLKHMREEGFKSMNPTHEAEVEFKKEVDEHASKGLFSQAASWYWGRNIPGKKVEALNFMGGMPLYRRKLVEEQEAGWPGFVMVK